MNIKICGLKRTEDIDYVNRYKPDWVGFVFAGKKRKIDFDTAKLLKSRLDTSIKVVGVFVNEDIEYILKLVSNHVIDMVQLHGDEDENYILQLKEELLRAMDSKQKKSEGICNAEGGEVWCVPIIKAVRVQNTEQVLDAQRLSVDYLLLDAFKEDEYGGSGKVFDHNLIPNLTKPYLLAGGIGSENAEEIIRTLERKQIALPFCLDVSSSVETEGCKDEKKIQKIVQIVHSCN